MLLERTWACCLVGALLTATTTVQARQDRPLPANYTNDLYHCFLEASLNLSGQQGGNVPALSDDGVLCDLDSYQWMIEQLNPDQPPARCVDFDALANGGTDSMNDDVLEPCILWHMNYGLLASESPSTVPSTAPSSKLEATTPATAAPVVASPSAQVEIAVNTTSSPSAFPSSPPTPLPSEVPTPSPTVTASSEPTRSIMPSSMPSLKPSTNPSATPTTAPSASSAPSNAPSESPSDLPSMVPSSLPTLSPSASPSEFVLANKPSVPLSGITLSFWITPITTSAGNSTRRLRHRNLQTIDAAVLIEELQYHLEEYMSESLSLELIGVVLAITFTESLTDSVTTARFDGAVYFKENDVTPTPTTIKVLTNAAFTGTSLRELEITFANNEDLASVTKIKLEDESFVLSNILNRDTQSASDGGMSTSMYVIIGGIGAGTVAIAFFAYLLVTNRKRSRQSPVDIPKNDTALSSPRTIDPESGQTDFPDNESDMTSVYSYIKDEGSVSIAPSYLYALNEQSGIDDSYDDSLAPPLWESSDNSPARANVVIDRNILDSYANSPSRSFVMADDENSLMSGAELQHVLSVERVSPEKLFVTGIGEELDTGGEVPSAGVINGTVLTAISPPRGRKDADQESPSSSPSRLADDTRDWKVKYGIPDDQDDEEDLFDDRPDVSLDGLSNIDEVTVETETEDDLAATPRVFDVAGSSDDDVYATDEDAFLDVSQDASNFVDQSNDSGI